MLLGVALGMWLLTVQPAGAQTTETVTVSYPEKDTKQVESFSARDPEGGTVYWYLAGIDSGAFSLSRDKGGSTALNFKKSPNFEKPMDRADTGDSEDACFSTLGTGECDNTYKVTVRAGDGGDNTIKDFMVEVTVSNVNETGSVTLTPVQPQAGITMTATATDPDENSGFTYQWAKSPTKNARYTTIQGETGMTYAPKPREDVGYFIKVTVTYRDVTGTSIRTVEATSDHAVRATPPDNKQPMFYDQTPGGTEDENDTAQVFVDPEDILTNRSVAENTPSGMPMGPRVTAYDADGDILTYKLIDGDATDIADQNATDGDSTKFSIDPRTGQIMTKTMLNYEGNSGEPDNCAIENACSVKVVAIDPSNVDTNDDTSPNVATSVTVTINITNVEEDPMVTLGTGPAMNAISADEFVDGSTDAFTLTSIPANYTYGASDGDEGTTFTYTVEGPDGGLFEAPAGVLAFKKCSPEGSPAVTSGCPNYEKPMDADNVYEVVVVATDPTLNKGTRKVTIKVSNVDENGAVTFPETLQPAVGERITAVLKDPDGGVKNVTWRWENNDSLATGKGAETATYEPNADDEGDTLAVTASYTDAEGSGKSASGTTVAVIPADAANTAPKFVDASDPRGEVDIGNPTRQ